MDHYTPDGIHIYSEWWFFAPAGAVLAALILFIVYLCVRPRSFLRRKWVPSLVIVLGTFLVGALTYFAFASTHFSMHASDYLAEGRLPSGILTNLSQFLKIKFAKDATVRAAVQAGSRDPAEWIAIEGDPSSLPDQLLKLGYEKHDIEIYEKEERLLEPIGNWIRESQFRPTSNFTITEGSCWKSFKIDQSRGLILVTIMEY